MSRRNVPPLTEREQVALHFLAFLNRMSRAALQRHIVRERLTAELADNEHVRDAVDAAMRSRARRRADTNVIPMRRRWSS